MDPERPQEPDEPVDPEEKPMPEADRSSVEDYHAPDRDPEVPLAGSGPAEQAPDPDEAYPHAEDGAEGPA